MCLIVGAAILLAGQSQPVRINTITPLGLSSNDVYNIIIATVPPSTNTPNLTVTNGVRATNVITSGLTNFGNFLSTDVFVQAVQSAVLLATTADGKVTNTTGAIAFPQAVTNNDTRAVVLNGQAITNVYESNIAVLTNGWGNQTIDFSRGTQIRTNITTGVTITGFANMNTTNLNWQVVLISSSTGGEIIVPAECYVGGFFTNATTGFIPTGTIGKIRFEVWSGVNTNATLEILQ